MKHGLACRRVPIPRMESRLEPVRQTMGELHRQTKGEGRAPGLHDRALRSGQQILDHMPMHVG